MHYDLPERIARRAFDAPAEPLDVRQAEAHLIWVLCTARECGGLLAALREPDTWDYGVWPVAALAWAIYGRGGLEIAMQYGIGQTWRRGSNLPQLIPSATNYPPGWGAGADRALSLPTEISPHPPLLSRHALPMLRS